MLAIPPRIGTAVPSLSIADQDRVQAVVYGALDDLAAF